MMQLGAIMVQFIVNLLVVQVFMLTACMRASCQLILHAAVHTARTVNTLQAQPKFIFSLGQTLTHQ